MPTLIAQTASLIGVSAVGLQHVAVKRDRVAAELGAIHDAAQTAPDEALDFLCAAALLTAGGFTISARTG